MPHTAVAIIGAGLAGLTAARVAREAGLEPLILEASERIGGRIESIRPARGALLGDLVEAMAGDLPAAIRHRRGLG